MPYPSAQGDRGSEGKWRGRFPGTDLKTRDQQASRPTSGERTEEGNHTLSRTENGPTDGVHLRSAQLGSAEYSKSESSTQTLDRPFAYELWGLKDESPAVIHETLARYLADNGWAANTASMGNLMESELVISFEWLGVNIGQGRFVELPGVRIDGGLMIARGDPREDELIAMSQEEMKRLYPSIVWPAESVPDVSIGMGLPDTIRLDSADFGTIWIDLQR